MSDTVSLSAMAREGQGKGPARALRREGKVPAIIYGPGGDPEMCALVLNDLKKVVGKRGFFNAMMTLDFGNGRSVRVLPREAQYHPVSSEPLHIDFYRAAEHATVVLEVPVMFLNEEAAPGIKEGGVLNITRRVVEAQVPVDSIPDHLEVDLTGLQIGDSVHISHVKLPNGVVPTITDRDFTICSVLPPTVATATEEPEPAGPSDVQEADKED